MRFRPAKGWLLVSRIETDDRLGSLVIPDTARERVAGWCYDLLADGGPVERDSEDEPRTEPVLKVGDWLLTPPRRAIDVDEEGLLLLPRDAVWAVIQ